MILVDRLLLQAVSSSIIHDISWSDHAPVSITVVEEQTPGPVFIWRANSCILQMSSHVVSITKNLTKFFSLNANSVSNATTLWCAHKAFIRGIILQFCSREKRRTQTFFWDCILSEIRSLESLNKQTADASVAVKLSKLGSDLRLMLLEQYEKHVNALKLTHYSEIEQVSFSLRGSKHVELNLRFPSSFPLWITKKYTTRKI